MITGGEPMTEPLRVQRLIRAIRKENTFVKIILYTTDLATVLFYCLGWRLDGLTVTVHDHHDARHFVAAEREADFDERLSLRLNLFKGIRGWRKSRLIWGHQIRMYKTWKHSRKHQ